jgi:hypothetical protein
MTGSQLPPPDERRIVPFPQRSGREPWWPKKRLAEYLDVSERTIERWTAEMAIPPNRLPAVGRDSRGQKPGRST